MTSNLRSQIVEKALILHRSSINRVVPSKKEKFLYLLSDLGERLLMRIKNGFRGLFSGHCILVGVLSRFENILQIGLPEMVSKTHVIPGIDQSLQPTRDTWGTGLPLYTFSLRAMTLIPIQRHTLTSPGNSFRHLTTTPSHFGHVDLGTNKPKTFRNLP